MRTGWAEREAETPRHPITEWSRSRRERLTEAVPGRAAGDPGGRLQGARERHRLPVPLRDRAHLPQRQPDQRRGARDRGRRGGSLRPAAQLAGDRRVLPRPAVRRPLGRPAPVAAARSPRPWTCRPATSTTCPLTCPGRPRPGCCAAWTRGSTARSPATTVATPSSPGCSPSCGWSRTSGRSPSCRRPATSPRSASRTRCVSGTRRSSTASAGSRAPSSVAHARWATTSATTRSSAAAGTPPRCTGSRTPARSPRASWCCSTWAPRRPRSTPPT